MQFEDTMQGQVDLGNAGDPPPARPMTKNEQNSAKQREAHRAGPGQPKPNGHRQEDARAREEKPSPQPEEQQQAGLHPSIEQAMQQVQQGNPLNGQDWFAKIQGDDEAQYYAAQELGQLLSAVFKVGGPEFSPNMHVQRSIAKAAALKGKDRG